MTYFCDPDFIIRYLLGDDPSALTKTQEIFEQAKSGKITLIIAHTVFAEVVATLSTSYKVPRDQISQVLTELLAYKGVSGEEEVLSLALALYRQSELPILDCLLLAKSKLAGATLLTFDQKLEALTQTV